VARALERELRAVAPGRDRSEYAESHLHPFTV
jgi:hypothetical protein